MLKLSIISLVFSILVNYYFQLSFNHNGCNRGEKRSSVIIAVMWKALSSHRIDYCCYNVRRDIVDYLNLSQRSYSYDIITVSREDPSTFPVEIATEKSSQRWKRLCRTELALKKNKRDIVPDVK